MNSRGGRLDGPIYGIGAGAMTLPAGKAALECPATVAVHDDCNVHGRVLFIAELSGKKIIVRALP